MRKQWIALSVGLGFLVSGSPSWAEGVSPNPQKDTSNPAVTLTPTPMEYMGRVRGSFLMSDESNRQLQDNCFELVRDEEIGPSRASIRHVLKDKGFPSESLGRRELQVLLVEILVCEFRKLNLLVGRDDMPNPTWARIPDMLLTPNSDLVNATFAGTLRSYLNVTGTDLEQARKNVASLLYGNEGLIERSRRAQTINAEFQKLGHAEQEATVMKSSEELVMAVGPHAFLLSSVDVSPGFLGLGWGADTRVVFDTVAAFYKAGDALVPPENDTDASLDVEKEFELADLIGEGVEVYLREKVVPYILKIANANEAMLAEFEANPSYQSLRDGRQVGR